MRAGNLRHKITIQTVTETRDALGGTVETWADTYYDYAAIWPLKSNEAIDSMQLETTITHKIRIRHRSGVNSKNRIVFNDPDGDRYFNIVSVINPDERNVMLEMLAIEEPLT